MDPRIVGKGRDDGRARIAASVARGGEQIVPLGREAGEASREIAAEAPALGAKVEHGVVIGIRLPERFEHGCQVVPAGQVERVQRRGVGDDEMAEIRLQLRRADDRPVRPGECRAVARDHEDVAAGHEVDLVGAKVPVDRRQDAQHQPVVQLVHVEPLPEDAVVAEVAPDPPVELVGEQSRHAAHPGIRRLGHDEVVPPLRRGEVALGVVDHVAGAGIVEGPAVGGIEDV